MNMFIRAPEYPPEAWNMPPRPPLPLGHLARRPVRGDAAESQRCRAPDERQPLNPEAPPGALGWPGLGFLGRDPSANSGRDTMNYVDGFVAAVPAVNKDVFLAHAKMALPLFKEFGATRIVECWGDDVPDGKLTDFRRAVKAEEGEVVLFSWIEWPSKEVRDSGMKKMMEDPRMWNMEMPFDGKRMIFGGFQPILDA
jgi:uncharacterized protein YbaA (DUF1428 family)